MSITYKEVQQSRQFAGFVEKLQAQLPPEAVIDQPLMVKTEPNMTRVVRDAWNTFGEGYIAAESPTANQLTFLLFLNHTVQPKTGDRWLSVGSGPGLIETYLMESVKGMHRVHIDCIDIARRQLEIHAGLLKHGKRNNGTISLSESSMTDIPAADNTYSQILCLNSLHWTPNWQEAVKEMGRVLSDRKGSQIIIVAGSANTLKDQTKTQVAKFLDSTTLLDSLDQYGLNATSIGYLYIDNAQFDMSSKRFYCVAERGLPLSTPIRCINYYTQQGKIFAQDVPSNQVRQIV